MLAELAEVCMDTRIEKIMLRTRLEINKMIEMQLQRTHNNAMLAPERCVRITGNPVPMEKTNAP